MIYQYSLNESTTRNRPPAGEKKVPYRSHQASTDIVRSFLAAMQARDLGTAKTFLAPDFTIIFPGNARFSTLEQLVEWGKSRYMSVGKNYNAFDECSTNSSRTVVYCYGTLYGQWLDGTSFDNIRFIDRFTIERNKLLDQQVWNDLAEISR